MPCVRPDRAVAALFSLLAPCALPACQAAAATEAQSQAVEREWAELEAIAAERPEGADKLPLDVYYRWSDANAARYAEKALPFIRRHANDPRRWRAVMHMIEHPRWFYQPYRPGAEPAADAADTERLKALNQTIDQSAVNAWRRKLQPLIDLMATAGDVPMEVQERYDVSSFKADAYRAQWGEVQRREMLDRINAHIAKFPDSRQAPALAARLISRVERSQPERLEATLEEFAHSAHPGVSAIARAKLRAVRLRREPLELKFTALDGREIDFAKLRGKVVLLDFWATWCGPCRAELANIEAVYEKYHAQGFEVIAVSLDRKSDRQKLLDFVRRHRLPWPQHFILNDQGRNVLAEELGVTAIPAPYLFDQSGRLVGTDARGEKLQAEVRRLLRH